LRKRKVYAKVNRVWTQYKSIARDKKQDPGVSGVQVIRGMKPAARRKS